MQARALCFSFDSLASAQPAQVDAMPSWSSGPAKSAIVAFVTRVTQAGGPEFVSIPERVAAFDNDGTLWSEQPNYFQFAFALDRVKELAPQDHEWKTTQPFKAQMLEWTAAGSGARFMGLVRHTDAEREWA
jgi:hypothetical protein